LTIRWRLAADYEVVEVLYVGNFIIAERRLTAICQKKDQ